MLYVVPLQMSRSEINLTVFLPTATGGYTSTWHQKTGEMRQNAKCVPNKIAHTKSFSTS
jgi:hypothetical protein